MKSKYVISKDSCKIAYNIFGNGYPLVLVHGAGSNKEMWIHRGWVDILKKNFTVIIIDIRGNGESDKSYDPEFYSIDNILGDINCVVKESGFNEFYYFGHSYGATIGLQMCKNSNNVKKLVCAGTIFGDSFFKEVVPKWIVEYESIGIKKKNKMIDIVNTPMEELEWIDRTDFELMVAQLKAWNKWDGVEIQDIRASLAIYSGTKDNAEIVDYLNENKFKMDESGIELKIFDNLDHVGLVEKIHEVSPWVLEFLTK